MHEQHPASLALETNLQLAFFTGVPSHTALDCGATFHRSPPVSSVDHSKDPASTQKEVYIYIEIVSAMLAGDACSRSLTKT